MLRARAEKFQPWVQPSDVVFELGVGSGWNLGQLRCARRIGFDAAGFLRDSVQRLGVEFIDDPRGLPAASVDVVLCHHTLEHVENPLATLQELKRLLRVGGRLVLHVPWERERRYARHRVDEPNHHLFTWNAQTLGNLALLAGFRIEHLVVRRYGYDRFAANLAAKWRLGQGGFKLARAFMILFRPLREVELVARTPDAHGGLK